MLYGNRHYLGTIVSIVYLATVLADGVLVTQQEQYSIGRRGVMGNSLSAVNLDAYHSFPGSVWGNVQHVLLRDAMRNRDAVGHEAQASTVTGP
jgi:hypothetical protein